MRDAIQPDLWGHMYRGMSLWLPKDVHDLVRDPAALDTDKAQALYDHMDHGTLRSGYPNSDAGRVGTHWTSHYPGAEGWSRKLDFSTGIYNASYDPERTSVVLHAEYPSPGQTITNPRTMEERGIFPYSHTEREIPLRNKSRVSLVGISFGENRRHAPMTHVPLSTDQFRA